MNTRTALTHTFGAACIATLLGSTACATTPQNFNPDTLPAAQLSLVQGVCQNVMGLSPTERLTGGNWHGDRLDYYTSKFRGCETSLSDSLQQQVNQQALQQASAACKEQGHAAGSPDLALCVLQSKGRIQVAAASQASTAPVTPAAAPLASPGSFYRVSMSQVHEREQMACAAIGMQPDEPAFDSCVKDLARTFFTIDNPIT